MRSILPLLVLGGMAFGWARAEEAKPPPTPQDTFKVERHIFASGVDFDQKGRCVAVDKVELRSWKVPGFPAQIPPFESCTTVLGRPESGEAEFVLRIVDRGGKTLQKVDGVLEFGTNGKGSQAIGWDHLEIPSPGAYHMVLLVDGKEIGRFKMLFSQKPRKKPGR